MPDIRLLVLTNKPREGREICLVDTAHRFSPFSLMQALKKSKMLIFGGGTLLQDGTSSQSLFYYLYVIRAAKKRGAHVYVFANGLGPLKKRNIGYVAHALKYVDTITLRDEISSVELLTIAPKKEHLITADPAIGIRGCTDTAPPALRDTGCPANCKKIGISIRQWHNLDTEFEKKLCAFLEYTHEKHGLIPVFIPMKYPADLKVSMGVLNNLSCPSYIIKKQSGVMELTSIVAQMDIVISMRLHSLIFAAGNSVPCVGITYDPKVRGFMEYIGQNMVLDPEQFSIDDAKRYVSYIMDNMDEIKNSLNENSKKLAALALKNSEIAIEILKVIEEPIE